MNQKKMDELYIDIAKRISKMSHATRNKVGCVIVKDGKILSMGWNGTPACFHNACEEEVELSESDAINLGLLELGEGKHLITKKEVLHSELNAIAKIARSTESSEGATIYITLGTCVECAKLIIQSGIKRVVYLEEYRDPSGIELLKKANIMTEKHITSELL